MECIHLLVARYILLCWTLTIRSFNVTTPKWGLLLHKVAAFTLLDLDQTHACYIT